MHQTTETEAGDTVSDADLRRVALGTLFPGFDGTSAPGWLLDLLGEGLAGVVLFERNVDPVDPDASVQALTTQLRQARADVIVAVDEEGGDVTRLDAGSGSNLPGAAALGVVDDPQLTSDVAAWLGARLHADGVSLNLAPVADVDADPRNPIIGIRSFGSEPDSVAAHVAAFVAGQQRSRVAATVKHFPGHGATVEDSHYTVPVVTASPEQLRRRELVPFRAAIAAGVQVVMTAHVQYPRLDDGPATLSRAILTDLLRGELGFEGVVMTDGLDMHAISQTVGHAEGTVGALLAGADAICIGGESTDAAIVERLVSAITGAVRSGRLPLSRLLDAAHRVGRLAAWTTGPSLPHDLDEPGAEAATRAIAVAGDVRLSGPPLVLELHDEPTIASGEVPWAIGEPLADRLPGTVVVCLAPHSADPLPALGRYADRPVVLAVRGLRRRAWQRDVVEIVRAQRPDVIVVDHELSADRSVLGPNHLRTFSGSRVSAQVAADMLSGRTPLPATSDV
jgi:beta-N-acetylhexosaminidase